MATNKRNVLLLQLIIFGFNLINTEALFRFPSIDIPLLTNMPLSTVPCTPVLENYFNFLTESHPGTVRFLSIQATFILQNRYVAYYTGTLNYAALVDSLNGTVTTSFSDRVWTPSCGNLFCPNQNFDYQKTDIQTITINRSGSIQYILNSWGNAKSTDQLQCYAVNKPFYTAPTPRSSSMFVMTLQKTEYNIPK